MDSDHINDDHNLKKGRHRKKHLYNAILKQMEFYFSDSNLSKDRFLSQLIQENPLIDVSTFLTFNKINNLTSSVDDIVKAVSHSELLDLSEDKLKVGRKLPVKQKDNVDDCTLYVERLKSDATHEWVTSIFSEFGDVVYVSIPKFKQNGIIKGFAFVEFENEEGCNAALQHFESIDCKISCSLEPEKLCSIVTFESESSEKTEKCDGKIEEGAEKKNENGGNQTELKARKRKCENEEEEVAVKKVKVKSEDQTKPKVEPSKLPDEIEKVGEEVAEKEIKVKKDEMQSQVEKTKRGDGSGEEVVKVEKDEIQSQVEKRKREDESGEDEPVKRLKITEEDKIDEMEQVEADLDGDDKKKKKSKKLNKKKLHLKELGLLVLSKKDWKKMRNRYLNMQRNTMKQLKMHLNQQKYGNRYKENEERVKQKAAEAEIAKKLEFESGVIVKVLLVEPCGDNKKLKAEIRALSEEIKFVDIPHPIGSTEIFIRFSTSESAQSFTENSKFDKGKSCVLTGEEEKLYMEKIFDLKMSKNKKNQTKQRGRDKLLKKAERQASQHIRFDTGDA